MTDAGKRRAGAATLVAACAGLVYAATLRNGFVWDDALYVRGNPFVQEPANLRHLFDPGFYTGTHAVLAGSRPLFLASLLADRALWGGDPAGFHATNVALHAANALWVLALGLELLPAGALFAALLFAVHPAQSEAVNGISFRSDLLASFFLLAALWTYLRARGRPWLASLPRLAAVAGLFGLGLLAKESAAALFLLLPLLEFLAPPAGESAGPRLRRTAAALGLCLAVAAPYAGFWAARFRHAPVDAPGGPREWIDRGAQRLAPAAPGRLPVPPLAPGLELEPSPPPWRELYQDRAVWFFTTSKAAAGALRLLLFPRWLVADRAPPLARSWREPAVVASWAVLLGAAAAALWAFRRRREWALGPAWAAAALLPVSGLVPLYNPVAERYLYAATAGFAWSVAQGLHALRLREGQRAAAMALLLAACAVRTGVRNRDWRSDRTLFFAPAPERAQNPRAGLTRATALWEEGRREDAARELEAALARHPGYTEAWLNLGMLRLELGAPAAARAAFERAVAVSPESPLALYGAGLAAGLSGDLPGAAHAYRRALRKRPGFVEAWVNLGNVAARTGDGTEARKAFETALALRPGDAPPYHAYARFLEGAGETERARALYRAALEREPGFRPARERLEALGARR